jgi:hypothetical protein
MEDFKSIHIGRNIFTIENETDEWWGHNGG